MLINLKEVAFSTRIKQVNIILKISFFQIKYASECKQMMIFVLQFKMYKAKFHTP